MTELILFVVACQYCGVNSRMERALDARVGFNLMTSCMIIVLSYSVDFGMLKI